MRTLAHQLTVGPTPSKVRVHVCAFDCNRNSFLSHISTPINIVKVVMVVLPTHIQAKPADIETAKMQFHLPLSPTDRILQPPVQYLVIQDVNLLYCSFAWTVAYVLYVRQAFRDQSYGMPIATL